MRISDWSSDVCSSDLDVLDVLLRDLENRNVEDVEVLATDQVQQQIERAFERFKKNLHRIRWDVGVFRHLVHRQAMDLWHPRRVVFGVGDRSEEHTAELQSLMRISYAVFCLK